MPLFKTLGLMLDMSRNGVMRVESVKQYIEYLQSLGFNMLLLYMEDVYSLEEYPMFGYMRGAYTTDELREIDRYAAERGIEVVPCIQTLGHMGQYLRHSEASPVRGTATELLCGEPETYRLIETMVSTMRACFGTGRIHIGMDESDGLNGGEYRRRHGERDRFTVFAEHLKQVCDICHRYDFHPMIWGDMPDGLKSDLTTEEKQALLRDVPPFDLVDWKYWTVSKDSLLKSFEADRKWGRHILFANGDSTWTGHLPNYRTVNRTVLMSAQAAAESGIDELFITSWGDEGRECNNRFGMGALLQLSEYNRTGEVPTHEALCARADQLGFMDYDTMLLGEVFNRPVPDTFSEGKRILWSDLLLNSSRTSKEEIVPVYRKAADAVRPMTARKDAWEAYYRYEELVFDTAALKCELLLRLRSAYRAGDRDDLREAMTRLLPELYADYEQLEAAHRALWLKDYKAFGWQVISARYGAQLMRIRYAVDRIRAYLDGEAQTIEELDAEPVPYTDSPVSPDTLDDFYVERMDGSSYLINMSIVC